MSVFTNEYIKSLIDKEGITEDEFIARWLNREFGYSVTGRIKKIKQPRGGYINTRDLDTISLGGDLIDLEEENISPGLVGTVVDYLTRFMSGTSVEQSFSISNIGASKLDAYNKNNNAKENVRKLMPTIKGLDDRSIRNAVKMTGYDVCYRAGCGLYKPV